QAVEPLVRRVEPGARNAQRSIGAPAKVAERHIAVGEMRRGQMLDEAEIALSLDERVTQEHDAIAIAQFEGVRGLRRGGYRREKRGHQSDRHHAKQFHSAKEKKLKPQVNRVEDE